MITKTKGFITDNIEVRIIGNDLNIYFNDGDAVMISTKEEIQALKELVDDLFSQFVTTEPEQGEVK